MIRTPLTLDDDVAASFDGTKPVAGVLAERSQTEKAVPEIRQNEANWEQGEVS